MMIELHSEAYPRTRAALSPQEWILPLEQTVRIFKVKVGELGKAVSLAKTPIRAPSRRLAL